MSPWRRTVTATGSPTAGASTETLSPRAAGRWRWLPRPVAIGCALSSLTATAAGRPRRSPSSSARSRVDPVDRAGERDSVGAVERVQPERVQAGHVQLQVVVGADRAVRQSQRAHLAAAEVAVEERAVE